jgi:hypothetical protein
LYALKSVFVLDRGNDNAQKFLTWPHRQQNAKIAVYRNRVNSD